MKIFSWLFLYSVFFIITFDSETLALEVEGVIGGFYARQGQFKYQVAIFGRLNETRIKVLICGGSIIADDLILTAAQCFTDNTRVLRPLRFSIYAGTVHLNDSDSIELDIDYIYVPDYGISMSSGDIAIARLEQKLDFLNNSNLAAVQLPSTAQAFVNDVGVVAGNGYTVVLTRYIHRINKIRRYDGRSSLRLKYAYVKIIEDSKCYASYEVDLSWQMCGLMMTERPGDRWGICTRDTGSPLVIDNTVVGIVSRNTPECDDTVHGCIYTKVSSFTYFIDNVVDGRETPNMYIYKNPVHVE